MSQNLSRQQIYDRIKASSKDSYILEEMKRLGFLAGDLYTFLTGTTDTERSCFTAGVAGITGEKQKVRQPGNDAS